MKKTLLASCAIACSVFSLYAQFKLGDVNLNVGRVDIPTGGGDRVILNPQAGQVGYVGANGQVQVNTTSGQVGVVGGIGGIGISALFGGGQAGGAGSFQRRDGLMGLFDMVMALVAQSVPLLIGIALLAFFWYLIEFIWKGREDSAAKNRSASGMLWSMLALFVMVSVWGIIKFFGDTVGIKQGGSISGFVLPGQKADSGEKK